MTKEVADMLIRDRGEANRFEAKGMGGQSRSIWQEASGGVQERANNVFLSYGREVAKSCKHFRHLWGACTRPDPSRVVSYSFAIQFFVSVTCVNLVSRTLPPPIALSTATFLRLALAASLPSPPPPPRLSRPPSMNFFGTAGPKNKPVIKTVTVSVPVKRILEDSRLRKDEGRFDYVSGASLVAGDLAKSYKPVFPGSTPTAVKLQYPGLCIPEKFTLVKNGVQQDYQPLDDIRETIKFICQNYFPENLAQKHLDDEHGFERRLLRAASKGCKEDYVSTIQDFNTMLVKAKRDGTISNELSTKHSLTLEWIQRILDQIYTRTVSPQVDSLKAYQNGTDNVYGELLPPLVSEMLNMAELKSDHVFVDLGSGVGNVCLQAALETGCESWGCEVMDNPCKLADLQAKEFPARARMWGLSVGKVHLLKGDFLANQKIGEVLKRADVVLVNNQAFSPDLNSKIMDRFLDLKDGCRIISLKPFKQEGYEISDRNQHDPRHLLVDERKLPFYSKCVSWTDAPGEYHIVRKSPERLKQFIEQTQGVLRPRRS
ncbi:DOT1-domain-containing protein [Aureobasidium pullulans]|uniref:Histone-lysine N-methyltransferase, H3 lysine-79 specific n=1 Tax=Aureobasidium pullulans TaxID=5580 RepID=A0A4T0BZD7_AURPU|nr:DOT1-domain-containing protein [Aureobasidium pullulans]